MKRTRKSRGKRAVGYVRVSDESQIEGYSLEAQRNEICRWCLQNGYELVAMYSDEGVSAYTDNVKKRAQFSRLVADADAGQFDIAVVHTLDRSSRKVGVMSQSLERLGKAGVGFASVTEAIDFTTPAGKMLLTVLSAAFELFSAMTGIHVRKSHDEKASRGVAVGPVPFGYRKYESGGVAAIQSEEAELVLEAFRQRANGASHGQIAAWRRDQGARTRKGRMFTPHAVKDMVNCNFYVGIVVWDEVEFEGQHEAIVTRELFDRVKERRRQHHQARLVRGTRGLLQGRIACIRCGRPLHSDRSHLGEPMYRERHSLDCDTNNHALMAHFIDDRLGSLVEHLTVPDDWRERMLQMACKTSGAPDPARLQDLRRKIVRAYGDGGYTDAEYEEKLGEIDARIRSAKPPSVVRATEAHALLTDLQGLWADASPEERSRLLAPLVERVYVDVESKTVCAITPADGFGALLSAALRESRQPAVLLPADTFDCREVWTWWRRGRIELPVQVRDALSMLQAYPYS